MVDLWEKDSFAVNTSSVSLKFISGFNTTSDWTILVDLSLHLLCTSEIGIVTDVVLFEWDSLACCLASFSNWAWWWDAVFAEILSFAISISSFISLFAEI